MTIDEYAAWVATRPFDPNRSLREQMTIAGLGLAGEAGEVVDLVKKCVDGRPAADQPRVERFIEELGDEAFYFCWLCNLIGVKPSHVLEYNKDKLERRHGKEMPR